MSMIDRQDFILSNGFPLPLYIAPQHVPVGDPLPNGGWGGRPIEGPTQWLGEDLVEVALPIPGKVALPRSALQCLGQCLS